MPLEDLTGTKYVSDLNETWPLGTDLPNAGDDHLRGIKNVLKKTFPYLTGPVTRTQDSLNRGSVPAGAVAVFYMAAAPAGWVRHASVTTTFMMRVVPTTTPGATYGGTHDPIFNDKVPAHQHYVNSATTGSANRNHTHTGSGNTGVESRGHTHSGVTQGANADHTHLLPIKPWGFAGGAFGGWAQGNDYPSSGQTAQHAHAFTTGQESANHTHGYSFTTAENNVSHEHTVPGHYTTSSLTPAASNWTPRYLDVILCVKL